MAFRCYRVDRIAFAMLAAAFLAACTTTPGGGSGQVTKIPHETSKLLLCKGMRVRNAPETDKQGRVKGFKPTYRIRGQVLSTAPVRGCLSSGFGGPNRRKDKPHRRHDGIDISTGGKVPVGAAGAGTIAVISSSSRGYGKFIDIQHGQGVVTRYAHLASVDRGIKKGTRVAAGQAIGRTGRTGNASGIHLHYEILVNGKAVDPLK
ncbi:MAG: M23 family metallopeptidase [Pseudomonadota bacterium]